MEMAKAWSHNSKSKRNKVGCIIVKGTMIISDGYNGTPIGFDNKCEIKNVNNEYVTKQEVLHAESNAICKLAKSTQSSEGAVLFTTLAPCFECSKLIIQAGIVKVYYLEDYRVDLGLQLLKKANIEIVKLK